MIEILIAVVIIGILVAIFAGVAVQVVNHQKVGTTQNIMRTVDLAIQQFATEDPLGNLYNNSRKNPQNLAYPPYLSFGPYPPYQLDGPRNIGANVHGLLEPNPLDIDLSPLADRLARDLSSSGVAPTIEIAPNGALSEPAHVRMNDDIRALYTYLRVFNPGVIEQIPASARQPLIDGEREYVNVIGDGNNQETRTEVLGIFDAWGVPLDYFLDVRIEFGVLPNGLNTGWQVVDRVPVVRSFGIDRELFASLLELYDGTNPEDAFGKTADNWLFSQELKSPFAGVDPDDGDVTGSGAGANGWARARALSDVYKYVPE